MRKIISCFIVMAACLLTTGSSFGVSLEFCQKEQKQITELTEKVNYLNKELESAREHSVHYGWVGVAAFAALFFGAFLGIRTVKNWRSGQKQELSNE
jgi:hypothetical protein